MPLQRGRAPVTRLSAISCPRHCNHCSKQARTNPLQVQTTVRSALAQTGPAPHRVLRAATSGGFDGSAQNFSLLGKMERSRLGHPSRPLIRGFSLSTFGRPKKCRGQHVMSTTTGLFLTPHGSHIIVCKPKLRCEVYAHERIQRISGSRPTVARVTHRARHVATRTLQ